ncbi:hypothetical protein [Azospirillum sp. ST 5-10]|uniref:hypothetical protein n=1 Tax=unclassified Azospirillum TaxID=2630922 RepID=UPI003F4A3387
MTAQFVRLFEASCFVGATSTTEQTVGTGPKTWTLAAGPKLTTGMTVRVEVDGDPDTWMEGRCTAAGDDTATVNVVSVAGSGTHAAWLFAAGMVRLSTGTYEPSDAPIYEPVLAEDGWLQGGVTLFADGQTFGASGGSSGAFVKAINGGGVRDHWRAYGWHRASELVVTAGADRATAAVMRTGRVEQCVVSDTDVMFRFRDLLAELDRAVQADVYAGDNAEPAGIEGSTELAGRNKPLLRGYRAAFEPVNVNGFRNIRQISAKAIHGIGAVKNGGVPLNVGTARATAAELDDEANEPDPGAYDYCLADPDHGAFIRTATAADLTLTVEAWEGATAADRTIAQVWKRTLIEDMGYDSAAVSSADVAALDAVCPYETGFWAGNGETARQVLDEICGGVAGYHADRAETWRLLRIAAPAGTPVLTYRQLGRGAVATLSEVPYDSLELVATADEGRGRPACRITLEFAPYDVTLGVDQLGGDVTAPDTDLVGGPAARERWKRQYLTVTHPAEKDPDVLRKFGDDAPEITFRSALRHRVDAEALAAALWAIYGVQRDRLKLSAPATPTTAPTAVPGVLVGAQSDRYGLGSGKVFLVLGVDYQGTRMTLDIWGAAT